DSSLARFHSHPLPPHGAHPCGSGEGAEQHGLPLEAVAQSFWTFENLPLLHF
ncbi:unnamed protein product, partial [Symbiodinium necroappetens]